MKLIFTERWAKNKIDPLELVALRDAGLTWWQIAARLRIGKTTALQAYYGPRGATVVSRRSHADQETRQLRNDVRPGKAVAHPMDYRERLWKIKYSILREVGDTPTMGESINFQVRVALMNYLKTSPAVRAVYDFKQSLCKLLIKRHRTAKQAKSLIRRFLGMIQELRDSGFATMRNLGKTLWENYRLRVKALCG